ncbi:MAG: alpha/beta hydrolase [Acidobacteriaceae bacterium]
MSYRKRYIRNIAVKITQSLRLPLLGVVALLMFGAQTAVWATEHKPAACEDQTPHQIRMVRVAPGVELEVLDWGGTGKTMVLLTGLGDNAHVFDQFAFQFTDYFHVVGITRRGFLPSSQPRNGYDVATRAADDIAVLDALEIDKAVFVGHSLAGSELSRLGLAYGGRVDKLVYLDAADLAERFSPSRREPPGAQPLFTEASLKSLWDFQAASARYTALREPNQSVCLNMKFDANGAITEPTSPQFVTDKLLAGVAGAVNPPTNWAKIKAPRLGIFAPFTLSDRQAWYWYLSAAKRAEFDDAWPPIIAWFKRTDAKFAEGNSGNTFTLPGAPHYIYINNEAQVVRWMRKFLGIPPRES